MILMSAFAAEMNAETLSEGTSGNDVIISLTPDELIDGGDGHDIMIGLGGSNVLRGGAGHDTLFSVPGDNVLDGGAGIDKAVYWNANRADYTVIDDGFGILEISGDRHSDFITNIEQVQFQDGTYSIEELLSGNAKAPAQGDLQTEDAAQQTVDSLKSSTSGDDVLIAGSSGETIDGLAGDDVILSLGNGNSVSGGDGDDALISAGGSNLIDGGNGRDTVIYTNGVRADYTIAPAAGGATSVTSSSGNDILLNVEVISFQDETVLIAAPPVVTDPVEEEVVGVVADYTAPIAGSVYGNVSDGSASLYQLKTEPSVGSLNFYGNGAFDLHAPSGFSGVVSFTCTVTGENGQTEEREVLIRIGDDAGNECDGNENEEVIDEEIVDEEEVIVDEENDAEMDDDCGYGEGYDYSDDSDDCCETSHWCTDSVHSSDCWSYDTTCWYDCGSVKDSCAKDDDCCDVYRNEDCNSHYSCSYSTNCGSPYRYHYNTSYSCGLFSGLFGWVGNLFSGWCWQENRGGYGANRSFLNFTEN